VLDPQRRQLYRQRFPTPAHSYAEILAMIEHRVKSIETELGITVTVGIGMPGAISPNSGLLRNSNTVCLNGQPFLSDIEKRLNRSVRIHNDANCFTLSETLNGAASGQAVVFGVIIGTGTGGGLVVNGQLLSGVHGIAGEWGHNPLPWPRIEDGEPACYCGKMACIETFLSGPGLARNYALRFGQEISSEKIVSGAEQGEKSCVEMMDTYHDQMARALAHVINIIDPDAIVLGGGMSNIDSIYAEIPRRLPTYVFSDYVETSILRAEHGDASGVFGAAMLWNENPLR
jgi:fructokinase